MSQQSAKVRRLVQTFLYEHGHQAAPRARAQRERPIIARYGPRGGCEYDFTTLPRPMR